MKIIIEILKNYRFDKKDFFYFLFFGIIVESCYLFFPKITQNIISTIETGSSIDDLYFWIIVLLIATIIFLSLHIVQQFFGNKLRLVVFSKKNQYYRELLFKKNYKDIIDAGTGKLITRINDGLNGEVDIFMSVLNMLISAIFRGILVLIILAFIIPKLILFVVIGIGLILFFNYFTHKYIQKYTKKEQELWEKDGRIKTRMIMENLIIRIFGKNNYELKKSKEILDKIPFYGVIVDTINQLFYKVLELTLRFLEIGVYIILGVLVFRGEQSIAFLVMVIGYVWFLWWPLDKAVSNLNRINRVWEKYKKLQKFINKPIEIVNGKKKYIYKTGKIELKNLDFSYENSKQLFDDFSLEFLPGKKNALVGHSGGGKSTIFKILLRLFEYQKGEILIDGQRLKDLKIETFYDKIGYLPQEAAIFDGTLRENLEYAFKDDYKYKDEEIWNALKKSKIDDMVKNLKDGLETEVGERGIKLSGGEKQRLAIARIFLKNPNIIILDEPTSALDSINEAKITETLNELIKGKTSIIIAHRLQTVMSADQIVVIEKGKIEKIGKHEELITSSKTYKKLVNLQNGVIEE